MQTINRNKAKELIKESKEEIKKINKLIKQ